MKPRAVHLHIEELVLEGFDRRDRYAVGEAVQQSLARLLAENGIPNGIASNESVDGGAFAKDSGATAASFGDSIANAVYKAMSGRERG